MATCPDTYLGCESPRYRARSVYQRLAPQRITSYYANMPGDGSVVLVDESRSTCEMVCVSWSVRSICSDTAHIHRASLDRFQVMLTRFTNRDSRAGDDI